MFEYDKLSDDPKGYKYKLKGRDYCYNLRQCFQGFSGHTTNRNPPEKPFVNVQGLQLFIRSGYAWNGANNFPDFEWILRASMVHDALCQILDQGCWKVDDTTKQRRYYRRCADREFFCIVKTDKGKGPAKVTYSAIRGYASGWLPGALLGGLFGLVRSAPKFECGQESQ